jgi:hypothetical protein
MSRAMSAAHTSVVEICQGKRKRVVLLQDDKDCADKPLIITATDSDLRWRDYHQRKRQHLMEAEELEQDRQHLLRMLE